MARAERVSVARAAPQTTEGDVAVLVAEHFEELLQWVREHPVPVGLEHLQSAVSDVSMKWR